MPAKEFTLTPDNQGNLVASGICKVTNQPYTVTVPAKQYAAWQQGELAQEAFPYLKAEEREFLMTHITPKEWEAIFPSRGR